VTLADVMIVILGLAIGFALARTLQDSLNRSAPMRLGRPEVQWILLGAWVLTGLGISLIVVDLRRPAIRCRRRLRRPGFVACLAATVSVGFGVGLSLLTLLKYNSWGGVSRLHVLSHASPFAVAPSVLVAWLVAGINPRRSFRDWWDRLGCLVGFCWVAMAVSLMLVQW
jgi:hypothetical protein